MMSECNFLPGGFETSASPELPPGKRVWKAKRNTVVAIAVAVAAVAIVATAPNGMFDPCGCAACGYVLFLFCFQNTFLEWPEVWALDMLLLSSAVGALLAPTLLQAFGLWQRGPWRVVALIFDACVVGAGYYHMVRGPGCFLPAGSLQGKTCIVTGCNTGIGFETATALARAGARVVFACRSETKARDAMRMLLEAAAGGVGEEQLRFLPLDVSSLRSVRRFVELLGQEGLSADTVVLNAGVMLRSRKSSEDGFELTMASNHFGHFLLVQLLLPGLLAAEERGERPRIVVVGSTMCYSHDQFDFGEAVMVNSEAEREAFLRRPYAMFRAYSQSKLANILFTTELARRLRKKGSKIPANIVHPGEVMTEVMRDMHPVIVCLQRLFKPLTYFFFKSPRQGSFCTLHVATAPSLATADGASGQFFLRLRPAPISRAGRDEAAAARLWDVSEKLTGAPHV